jgi:hypothetical protein
MKDVDKKNDSFQIQETDEERRARLTRPVGVADYLIIKEKCADIPDDFILRLLSGGNDFRRY